MGGGLVGFDDVEGMRMSTMAPIVDPRWHGEGWSLGWRVRGVVGLLRAQGLYEGELEI